MPHPIRRRPLVLVVDDDSSLRDSIRLLLESMGFLVSTAANSGAAIQEVTAQRPDAILTDIHMPEGDGYELISGLRAFGHQIPIVAMTGTVSFSQDHLGMAKRLGATATIAKPFRGAQLVETLDRAMAGRAAA